MEFPENHKPFYPLERELTQEEWDWYNPTLKRGQNVQGKLTGQFRPPRQGEWFLADWETLLRATCDLDFPRYIAELAPVEEITLTYEVRRPEYNHMCIVCNRNTAGCDRLTISKNGEVTATVHSECVSEINAGEMKMEFQPVESEDEEPTIKEMLTNLLDRIKKDSPNGLSEVFSEVWCAYKDHNQGENNVAHLHNTERLLHMAGVDYPKS